MSLPKNIKHNDILYVDYLQIQTSALTPMIEEPKSELEFFWHSYNQWLIEKTHQRVLCSCSKLGPEFLARGLCCSWLYVEHMESLLMELGCSVKVLSSTAGFTGRSWVKRSFGFVVEVSLFWGGEK